jgi:hypothetical protein
MRPSTALAEFESRPVGHRVPPAATVLDRSYGREAQPETAARTSLVLVSDTQYLPLLVGEV